MTSNALKFTVQFFLLVLVQVLVLNQISILGYAVPFLYIYFIIKLPANTNKSLVILLGFLLGFTVDIFTNSYGINASATVLAAFVRPYIQKLFFSEDDFASTSLGVNSLGASVFYKYAATMVLIHHAMVFLVEYMSFSEPMSLVLHALFSSLLTVIIIIGLESFSYKRSDKI